MTLGNLLLLTTANLLAWGLWLTSLRLYGITPEDWVFAVILSFATAAVLDQWFRRGRKW